VTTPISEQELHAFVDGLLAPARRQAVTAWLESHPEDAQRVAAYRRLNAELRQAYPQPSGPWRIERRPTAYRAWVQAAAMAVFTLLGGLGGWLLNQSQRPPPPVLAAHVGIEQSLVQPAQVSHRVYTPEVLHPVEVRREQQQHLVGWLSKRLGKPVNAPDLAPQGFTLMGGRLLPATDGPAAQFMYENEAGQRLTLYVRQADDKKEQTAFHRYSQDGLSSFYWVDGGLGYALTGDIDPEQLMRSAERVYRQLNF